MGDGVRRPVRGDVLRRGTVRRGGGGGGGGGGWRWWSCSQSVTCSGLTELDTPRAARCCAGIAKGQRAPALSDEPEARSRQRTHTSRMVRSVARSHGGGGREGRCDCAGCVTIMVLEMYAARAPAEILRERVARPISRRPERLSEDATVQRPLEEPRFWASAAHLRCRLTWTPPKVCQTAGSSVGPWSAERPGKFRAPASWKCSSKQRRKPIPTIARALAIGARSCTIADGECAVVEAKAVLVRSFGVPSS